MAEVSSLAQLMKANARLKKHAEVAKKTVANKDYTGPVGEVVTTFQRDRKSTRLNSSHT